MRRCSMGLTVARGDWCSERAIEIAREVSFLPRETRAERFLELIGCLAAEAGGLIGREPVSEALYALADTVVGEVRIPRRGDADG